MSDFKDRHDDQEGEKNSSSNASPLTFLLTLPRLLVSRYGLVVLGGALLGSIIYMAISADGFMRSSDLEKEKLKLLNEIAALEDENRLLAEKLARLQTDPAYVEDEARKKLGLVRSGEIIYRLAEEPDLAEGPSVERPLQQPPKN